MADATAHGTYEKDGYPDRVAETATDAVQLVHDGWRPKADKADKSRAKNSA